MYNRPPSINSACERFNEYPSWIAFMKLSKYIRKWIKYSPLPSKFLAVINQINGLSRVQPYHAGEFGKFGGMLPHAIVYHELWKIFPMQILACRVIGIPNYGVMSQAKTHAPANIETLAAILYAISAAEQLIDV
jgi:hypothetical protein